MKRLKSIFILMLIACFQLSYMTLPAGADPTDGIVTYGSPIPLKGHEPHFGLDIDIHESEATLPIVPVIASGAPFDLDTVWMIINYAVGALPASAGDGGSGSSSAAASSESVSSRSLKKKSSKSAHREINLASAAADSSALGSGALASEGGDSDDSDNGNAVGSGPSTTGAPETSGVAKKGPNPKGDDCPTGLPADFMADFSAQIESVEKILPLHLCGDPNLDEALKKGFLIKLNSPTSDDFINEAQAAYPDHSFFHNFITKTAALPIESYVSTDGINYVSSDPISDPTGTDPTIPVYVETYREHKLYNYFMPPVTDPTEVCVIGVLDKGYDYKHPELGQGWLNQSEITDNVRTLLGVGPDDIVFMEDLLAVVGDADGDGSVDAGDLHHPSLDPLLKDGCDGDCIDEKLKDGEIDNLDWTDFVDKDTDTDGSKEKVGLDQIPHGSLVNGMLVAIQDGNGILGMAHGTCRAANFRVVNEQSEALNSDIVKAMINIYSASSKDPFKLLLFPGNVWQDPIFNMAVKALSAQVLMVAPTGNDGITTTETAANLPRVIGAVGFEPLTQTIPSYSNEGPYLDVAANSEFFLSTTSVSDIGYSGSSFSADTNYEIFGGQDMAGTSLSAAAIVGAAALVDRAAREEMDSLGFVTPFGTPYIKNMMNFIGGDLIADHVNDPNNAGVKLNIESAIESAKTWIQAKAASTAVPDEIRASLCNAKISADGQTFTYDFAFDMIDNPDEDVPLLLLGRHKDYFDIYGIPGSEVVLNSDPVPTSATHRFYTQPGVYTATAADFAPLPLPEEVAIYVNADYPGGLSAAAFPELSDKNQFIVCDVVQE